MSTKVLVVDDDRHFSDVLATLIHKMGYWVDLSYTLADGLSRLTKDTFDLVLLDVNLPDGSGLESIARFKQGATPPEIIIITGAGDAYGAELAMRNGVWDYIDKGSPLDAFRLSLKRAVQYREERNQAKRPVVLQTDGLLGQSRQFRACLELVAQAADNVANVLLTGETGTGKEMFARAIHSNSSRSKENFVIVDCAALPESLIENQLFGHEKGAYTGADSNHVGLIEQADGGTLFLDEIGELPLSMQKPFLRVLQEKQFRAIGANQERKSNFRLIAATNRNLDEMVEKHQFREDLLFRLQGIKIQLPPLRDRREDIRPLVYYFVERYCVLNGMDVKGLSPEFLDCLGSYDWPGNVRELSKVVEGAIATAGEQPILYCAHFPPELRGRMARGKFKGCSEDTKNEQCSNVVLPYELSTWKKLRDRVEQEYARRLTESSGGSIETACQISGLSRARVYEILKKHGYSLND